jgi:hypothetical protein
MSLKFYELIGFRFARKQLKGDYLPTKTTRDNADVIPYSKDFIFSLRQSNKLDYQKIIDTKLMNGNFKNNSHFSRMFLLRWKEFLLSLNNETLNTLYENIEDNIKWEPIKKITPSENYVFDFSLNNVKDDKWCHSVIYNGMLGHNTPLGLNHFHTYWKKAQDDESDFYGIKIHYWEVPGYDTPEFKKDTILNTDLKTWKQEYQCSFLGSSSTLIDPDILEQITVKNPVDIKWNGVFNIYEQPIAGVQYVLGVDSAKGTGKNFSVIQVLKIEDEFTVSQVAVYRNNTIDYHNFSEVVISVSKFYNKAQIMLENNGEGYSVGTTIWYEFEYDSICNVDDKGIGIKSDKKTKLEAHLLLKRYMENNWLKICDKTTVFELTRYVEVSVNIFKGESETVNDDCVTSLLWALYFVNTTFFDGRGGAVSKVQDKFALEENEDYTPVMVFDGGDGGNPYSEGGELGRYDGENRPTFNFDGFRQLDEGRSDNNDDFFGAAY